MIRIAINGFGRIGRMFLRTIMLDAQARKQIEVVAINIGPAQPDSTAHIFMYDTTMGTYPGTATFNKETNEVIIDGSTAIKVYAQKDASLLPWQQLGIDWVVECSGHATHRAEAELHKKSGARAVLISAPAHDEDITIIPGINQDAFSKVKHTIVSLGSCTTNAFIPLVYVIDKEFKIINGLMNTVHAYTNSQHLLDSEDKDWRRARAAALNIIPTSTGASKTLAKVLPTLGDKISSTALRVPVAKVSFIDFTFTAQKSVTMQNLAMAFENAATTYLKNILTVTNEQLVSSDFSGNPSSVIIDMPLLAVQGTMAKVSGWYDNEWGYSCRLKDFLIMVA